MRGSWGQCELEMAAKFAVAMRIIVDVALWMQEYGKGGAVAVKFMVDVDLGPPLAAA